MLADGHALRHNSIAPGVTPAPGCILCLLRTNGFGNPGHRRKKQLREILIWFHTNLPHPPRSFDASRATFWFKSSAKENIAKIWELIHFLRLHDHHLEVQKCSRLANIVFNDKYQVAAYPSERDGKVTTQ